MGKGAGLLILLMTAGVLGGSARAELPVDTWAAFDVRTYPWDRVEGRRNVGLRVVGDLRHQRRLSASLLRLGPIIDVTGWMALGVHVLGGLRLREGELVSEYRLELEPEFSGRLGTIDWSNRHRMEVRWLDGAWSSPRYRTQVRLGWAPSDRLLRPFVQEEVVVAFEEGVNQNRIGGGLAWKLSDGLRLDTWYMFRSVREAGWRHQHIIVIGLQAAPPRVRER